MISISKITISGGDYLSGIKFIDLFAGIGGFRQALESKNAQCVFSSEWNPLSQKVYFDNYHDVPFGDITKIPANSIPSHDILCAGFPCQAFSVSGKRLGFEDTRGTLFFDIARIAKVHRPKVLLLENVKNFLNHNQGNTMKTVSSTLEKMGYKVFSQVLRSSDYGSPQARERVYIVAIHNFKGTFNFPKSSSHSIVMKDILIDLSKNERKLLEIKRNDIEFYRDDKSITNSKRAYQIGKINKGGQGERIYSINAAGITLSAYGGGAAAKTGAYKVKRTIRKLHPLECLRMQGFPDDFKLNCSFNQSYQLLGNSVTTNVIKALYNEIYQQVFTEKRRDITL